MFIIFFLLSLLSVSFSLSAKRFSLTSLTFFALNSVDSLNLLCSYFFCLLSLLSVSFSLSAKRFSLTSLTFFALNCRGLYSNIFGDEYHGNLLEDFAGVEGNYNLWKQILLKF